MWKYLAILLGAAMLSAAAPSVASPADEAFCETHSWLAKCDDVLDTVRLRALGLPSLASLHQQHRQVLRAFYDDSFQNAFPAIVVERLPDGRGRLTVATVVTNGRTSGNLFKIYATARRVVRRAVLSRAVTTSLFAEAPVVFDSPVTEAEPSSVPDANGLISVCLDPDGARVEVASAQGVVSRERTTCVDSPVWSLAWRLAKVATHALPPCERVRGPRGYYGQLQACARLSGDLPAAADVYDVDWGGRYGDKDPLAARESLRRLLSPSVTLEIEGGPHVEGPDAFMAAWSGFASSFQFDNDGTDSVEGLNATTARTKGWLEVRDGEHSRVESYEILWRLGEDRRWRIQRLVLGAPEIER
jgi:hypothetical protein